eukprot:TRINITY_DN109106_c0_g1_i1.p1 TRINITY_DN109106_c0_g1~~TRINITY_DN109106_c0_g1_i1.p1  ORF type:complete len:279 (+),score=17.42 TRINITY_DN109106_c0_g1_i1:51-887(+)
MMSYCLAAPRTQKVSATIFVRKFRCCKGDGVAISRRAFSSATCSRTRAWVENFVVPQRLCPFAKPLLDRDVLRIRVSNASCTDSLLPDFEEELDLLVRSLETEKSASTDDLGNSAHTFSKVTRIPESTLLVIKSAESIAGDGSLNFLSDFRDFYRCSWQLQTKIHTRGLEEQIQIVLFHPQATHSMYETAEESYTGPDSEEAGSELEPATVTDPSNFLIRSPFPTFHLLRETDVLKAIKGYGGPERAETIPARNKERFRKMGISLVRTEWEKACSAGS